MKLKGLQINAYRHLQNLTFDFTYPEGHASFGQPLKKICIIGQSATGKTSVLELIKQTILSLSSVEVISQSFIIPTYSLPFIGELQLEEGGVLVTARNQAIVLGNKELKTTGSASGPVGRLLPADLKLLYFSAEIISKEIIEIFNQNPVDILNKLTNNKSENPDKPGKYASRIYQFGQELSAKVWFALLSKILDYRKRFTQMAAELINKGSIGDMARLNREFEKWSHSNKNPLIEFANQFNPILNKLNLEIDLINTQYPIPIKLKNKDEVIPISNLSTGTKGLLLSMFPLYELDTSNSLILVDEPERSLFPDLQIDLISHYQKLAPKAQLMVATHSPFIAAAFEPEERFILYFDEDGNVKIRRGESPIGDDPNDILANDFNIDYYNDFGKKAYQRYLDLKKKAVEEAQPEKKKALIKELSQLGDKYNFE